MIRDAYRWIEGFFDDRIAKLFRWTGKRITPFYWFRAHTFNRYHIINISGMDGYKWGWTNSDSKMELACFRILVDFVEKEYPGCVDWDYDDEIKKIRDEFMEIYEWWTKAEEDAMNELFEESGWNWSFSEVPETKAAPALRKLYSMNTTMTDPAKYAEYVKRQEAAREKQEEMLIKLIKLRKYLWT